MPPSLYNHFFRERLPDAAHELNGILSDEVLSESNVPVLILANKIDKPEALGEFELVQGLGIYDRQAWVSVRSNMFFISPVSVGEQH